MGKSSGNLEFMKTHAVRKGCDVLGSFKTHTIQNIVELYKISS
jgi:hypothetical protein